MSTPHPPNRLLLGSCPDSWGAEDLSFGQAVAMGASCEPPYGLPDVPPVLAALDGLGAELFTVVEQDMYPCDFSKPKPIAARTYAYLNSHGLGGPAGGAA